MRIFLQRTRKGHYESDQHWINSKDNSGETSVKQSGAHLGFPKCIDAILNYNNNIEDFFDTRLGSKHFTLALRQLQ